MRLFRPARELRAALLQRLFPLIVRGREPSLVRLGSSYGGWWVPESSTRVGSVCYLAGAGEDITLDEELCARGCTVVCIDPTPRAVAHVAEHRPRGDFTFIAVGLAGRDGTADFYVPEDSANVSHSMVNLQRTSQFFVAPVRSLASLMLELGHAHLDLLKLDIEGAEHQVIAEVVRMERPPRVLCVEFDQPDPIVRTLSSLRALKRKGYIIQMVEGFNVTLTLAGTR